MCINCNLITPLKHYICELLGLPYNMIGIPSSVLDSLSAYIIDIHFGVESFFDFESIQYIKKPELYEEYVYSNKNRYTSSKVRENIVKIHNYIVNKGLYEWFKNKILLEYKTEKQNIGPCDYSIYNHILGEYFKLETEELPPEFFDNLDIDVSILADDMSIYKIKDIKKHFKKIKLSQVKPIPRSYFKKEKFYNENYIIVRASMYNIDLLDEPFTDEDDQL